MKAPRVHDAPRPFFQSTEGAQTAERRLLLISYHFPPGQAAGALRWQKLVPHVAARRWGLDVITLHPSCVDDPDMSRLARLSATRVYGIPDPMLPIERAEHAIWKMYRRIRSASFAAASASHRGRAASRAVVKRADSLARAEIGWNITALPLSLRRAYFAGLEYRRSGRWSRRAAALALRLSQSSAYQAVITCGPPHMAHEAGRRVALATGLPFVVDLRDPWSLVERLPEAIASPVWLALARRYEQRAMARATLVIANTEPLRLALQAAYPAAADRTITVMNGYDDDVGAPRSRHGSRFTIAYAGSIYLDRDPRIFLTAAGRLVHQLRLQPRDFGIELMGTVSSHDGVPMDAIVRNAGLEGFVRTYRQGTRREALEFLANATMLLSLPQDSDLAIPSKLFEYMSFDAWILALADRGSATDRLLRDSDADVVKPHDADGILAVLSRRYREYAEGRRPTRLAVSPQLSRQHQAGVLLDALEQCLQAPRVVAPPRARPRPLHFRPEGLVAAVNDKERRSSR